MMNLSYWGLAETANEMNAIKEFDLKHKIYSIYVGVTTNDDEIKRILRALIEPITVFGEGKYERRERLKKILLYKYDRLFLGKDPSLAATASSEAKNMYEVMMTFNIDMSNVFSKKPKLPDTQQIDQTQDAADRETFYTEGSEEVKQFRSDIAAVSWRRMCMRKAIIHRFRDKSDQYEHKDHVEGYGAYLSDTLALSYSHVAGERPLTGAKFSPNVKHIAVTNFESRIKVFSYNPQENFPTLRVLDNDLKEMVHCLDWNCNNNPIYDRGYNIQSIHDHSLLLATGHSGGSVSIWKPFYLEEYDKEASENYCIHSVMLHEARVNRIKFHPLNNVLLSASVDETVRVFDLDRLQELYVQEGHSHPVHALAVNGDGNLTASGDMHGVMLIMDLRTGRHVFQNPMHNGKITAIEFHPLNSHIMATAGEDNSVKIFDLRKVRTVTSLLGHHKLVSDLQFEPTYGRFLATSSFDTHIKVWDTSEYKCRKVLPNNDSKVMSVNIAADSSAIITACYDRTVRIFKPTVPHDMDMGLDLN
ncbi:wd40 repeat protein [Babesia gibsoni]|uniref:Wd40 repeat protein n=1 Tax=Babesia gibsoni TaxID=33632 RepID=A0AAD8LP67_BABGI|nr:wd40 repeat protein [Babesia gibsoni]